MEDVSDWTKKENNALLHRQVTNQGEFNLQIEVNITIIFFRRNLGVSLINSYMKNDAERSRELAMRLFHCTKMLIKLSLKNRFFRYWKTAMLNKESSSVQLLSKVSDNSPSENSRKECKLTHVI